MAVTQADIKFFKSTNGLGGAITATQIVSGNLHDIFDIVDKDESRDGDTEYRCIYVKNTNVLDIFAAVEVYLSTQTASPTTSLAFGLGTAAVGGTEQSVVDESTAPVGVTFTDAIGVANSQLIGDIGANSYKAIWLRRIVQAATSAASTDTATLVVDGSTVS